MADKHWVDIHPANVNQDCIITYSFAIEDIAYN